MSTTTVSGTLTFQSEKTGALRVITFPAFRATTETPYIDLIDRATELVENRLPDLGDEYGWIQVEDHIIETVDA